MHEYFLHVSFPTVGRRSSKVLQQTLERGIASGWTTTREGDTDRCPFTDPERDRYLEWEATNKAIETLTERRHGSITFFVDDGAYDFGFAIRPDWSEFGHPDLGGVTLLWHRSQFREDPATATKHVFDVATLVYESLSPAFAFSSAPIEVDNETEVSESDVETGTLPDAFWLMILASKQCERVGRERLQSVPAWISEPVADESWGVVATADPYRYVPKDKDSVREHLHLLLD